jgi:hypothetical protein
VLALAVLAVIGATISTAILNNLRHTTTAGQRTQGAQVLNYLGRRVAGGDAAVLPNLNDTLAWDYGELGDTFTDLQGADGVAEPDRYRVDITASGTITVAGASVVQYDITVCFQARDAESCVAGTTMGAPAIEPPGSTPPLPGIN